MNSAQNIDIFQSVRQAQSDASLCATFHLMEQTGKWIQYGDSRINAAYPLHRDPANLVRTLGGELESWEANSYITVDVAAMETADVARWIHSYFRWILASRDAAMTVRMSRFKRCLGRA